MNDLVAKTIIKNKYWVVEQSGNQVATIQAVENGGFVYVHDDQRETYANVKNIKSKTYRYNVLQIILKVIKMDLFDSTS